MKKIEFIFSIEFLTNNCDDIDNFFYVDDCDDNFRYDNSWSDDDDDGNDDDDNDDGSSYGERL